MLLLPETLHLLRVLAAQPRLGAVVDLGLADPAAQRLGSDPELLRDPLNRAVIGAQLLAELCTARTARSFSASEYRRVVGFPGDISCGMTPSSFPRSGASNHPRATHCQLELGVEAGDADGVVAEVLGGDLKGLVGLVG